MAGGEATICLPSGKERRCDLARRNTVAVGVDNSHGFHALEAPDNTPLRCGDRSAEYPAGYRMENRFSRLMTILNQEVRLGNVLFFRHDGEESRKDAARP